MYFEELSKLTHNGNLRLLFIISPPRTGSTLLETSLSHSPSVRASSHEPFIHVGYSELDPELGYKAILDSTKQIVPSDKGPQAVIVKDMASWVTFHDEHERLFSLTNDPVLFLIRNPLLATESRIRKVVRAISLTPRASTQQSVIEILTRGLGKADLSAELGLHQAELENAYSIPNLSVQEILLSYYASRLGYPSWEEFVANAFDRQDYTLLAEVLNFDTHRFSPQTSGWQALQQLVRFMENSNRPYSVVDSTELRLDPEGVSRQICSQLDIEYHEKMTNWNEKPREIGSGQKRPQDLIWYDTLMDSRGIKPPVEVLPRLRDFPREVREQLAKVDLPVYAETFKNQHRIRGRQEAIFRQFPIDASESAVSILDVDPIFSSLQNPLLLNDKEYIVRKRYYLEELTRVATLREKFEELAAERDFKGRRK